MNDEDCHSWSARLLADLTHEEYIAFAEQLLNRMHGECEWDVRQPTDEEFLEDWP